MEELQLGGHEAKTQNSGPEQKFVKKHSHFSPFLTQLYLADLLAVVASCSLNITKHAQFSQPGFPVFTASELGHVNPTSKNLLGICLV